MFTPETMAKIVTLNKTLISQLSLEEVFQFHPLLDAQKFPYRICHKTKPIKVKPASAILVADHSLMGRLLLATLEANEVIKPTSYICMGVDYDFWMQTEAKLHAKYDLLHIDLDGWIHCTPKPDVSVNFFRVENRVVGPAGGFSVINATNVPGKEGWGDERMIDGNKVFLQYGIAGDYVLQNMADPLDTYVIRGRLFTSTYSEVSARC